MKINNFCNEGEGGEGAERIDDLGIGKLKAVQHPKYFCFGVDAVLLANYVRLPKNADIAEFCAGNAVISILLTEKQKPKTVVAFEFQSEISALAQKSVEISGVADMIKVVTDDICNADRHIPPNSLDAIVVNPPYVRRGAGLECSNRQRSLARQETTAGPDELFDMAARLLKVGGDVFMVNRPDRLADLFCAARNSGIEPRELSMVHPNPNKAPNICLIRFKKGAGRELKMLPSLYLYDAEGRRTLTGGNFPDLRISDEDDAAKD